MPLTSISKVSTSQDEFTVSFDAPPTVLELQQALGQVPIKSSQLKSATTQTFTFAVAERRTTPITTPNPPSPPSPPSSTGGQP